MNKGIYRLVFNAARAVWMAVGEYVRGHVAGSGKRRRHAGKALVLVLFFAGVPVYAGTLAANTVPTGLAVTFGANTTINAPVVNPANAAGQLLQVQQGALKAILQGNNFNIGSASEVRIDSTTGAPISTLIRNVGPKSIIEGALTSLNGDVYVISPNGILFGNGARVNVHGLVASALDIADSDFLNDLGHLYPITDNNRPAYVWQGDKDGFATVLVQVEPDARIKAGLGGSVMLFAPKVLNQGSIETTEGQVVMAAGGKVYLSYAPDPNTGLSNGYYNYAPDSPYRGLAGVLVEVDPNTYKVDKLDANGQVVQDENGKNVQETREQTGSVINDTMGRILAQRGNVTMASFLVNQSGRVTATSSVTQKGSIRLLARDHMTTTSVDVTNEDKDVQHQTIISASRTGNLQLGDGSVTAILPEDAAAVAKTNEILGSVQTGEPTPHSGEKNYLQTVLETIQSGTGTITEDQVFNIPTLEAIGRTVTVGDNVKVVAPGGSITLSAQSSGLVFNPNNTQDADSHLYLGKNSLIDAAGLRGVDIAMDRNFVEVLLTLNDLQDDPLNKYGFLNHKKVWFDIRDLPDAQVANLEGYVGQVPRTLGEKLAAAGSVKLQSEGDLVQRAGSKVDVSGGSLKYSSGIHKETWVLDANGNAYALGSAPAGVVYTGFLDSNQDDRINAKLTRESGYTEGKAAGTLTLNAWQMALDGTLAGGAIYGEHQRDAANLGGKLLIGDANQSGSGAFFKVPGVDFVNAVTLLPDSYAAGDALSPFRADTVQLDAGMLNRSGFEDMAIYADGNIRVNAALNLPVGGRLALTGRNVEVNGNIVARGGSITLKSQLTRDTADYASLGVTVGNGVVLDVSGLWVNNYVDPYASGRIVTQGGSIALGSGDEVVLGTGSLLDVSGGGWLQSSGKVKAGDAGNISIASQAGQSNSTGYTYTAPVLNGELRGYALGRGGSLSISAPFVTVGDNAFGDARELWLTPGFFQSGGFTSYSLTGRDGVLVRSGTQIDVVAKNYQLRSGYLIASTGRHVADIATRVMLPDYQRSSTSLAFSTQQAYSSAFAASGVARGSVVVETGALLRVQSSGNRTDSQGNLVAPRIALDGWNNQVYVDGTLQAVGGEIALTMNGDATSTTDDGYNAAQAIWLGSNARLLAAGYVSMQPDASGLRKGTVYDGGNIAINAIKGYVVAQQGSILDVSGTMAILDVLSARRYAPTAIASNGGAITLQAREGMLLDATYRAASPGALGGSLDVRLTRGTSTTIGNIFANYPGTTNNVPNQNWYVDLAQSGTFTPAGLQAGDALQPQAAGLARIAADRIMDGGFSSVALGSEYGVRFNGDVSLSASRMLRLDARIIEATAGSLVTLSAPDVMMGDIDSKMRPSDSFIAPAPVFGNSTLAVNAQLIDMRGQFALSSFSKARFISDGDIRLSGFTNSSTVTPLGILRVTGELDFTARQVYPTSLSAFTIAAEGAGGKVKFIGTGGHDTVLSAGGSLTVNAETIDQAGVLLAPFGTLALNAGKSLTLESGSLTSVSANGALIPFGYTDRDGLDYRYNFDAGKTKPFTAPPERRVKLSAPDVTEAAGSTVDISGGGDLYAYEWVPGTGGSTDVLANGAKLNAFGSGTTNTWAIMPASKAPYASYDTQYWQGSGIKAGDAVYLSGAPNLKDGYYTLLPARYALLPGAMLVSAVSGNQEMPDGQALSQVNGSTLVSGHLAAYTSAGYVLTSRTGGFLVRPGSDAHQLAEYNDALGSTYFKSDTQALLPADAGRFSVAATNSLLLDGVLNALHQNGRGAEVDIAAPNLLVVDHGATTGAVSLDGKTYLAVDENTLAGMNAASLLLGGTRSNGVIDVVASEVRLANNAAVSGSEVMLAATDMVRLQDGSQVTGTGNETPARDLTIGSTSVDGDGALLRVAGGAEATLTRNNTNRDRGDLVIDAGAAVHGDGSMLLDATRGMSVAGTLGFNDGAALAVAAGRISLGAPDAGARVTEGLWLTQSQLSPLQQVARLTLQSYSTIDLYGAVDIGNANLDLTLQGAGIYGYQNAGHAATFTARTFTMANDGGAALVAAPALSDGSVPALGSGTLDVQAQKIVIGGAKDVSVAGFSQAGLNASREIVAQGTGKLSGDHDMTLSAPRVTAQSAADQTIQVAGALTLQGTIGIQPTLDSAQAQGAKLKLSGESVRLAGEAETLLADGTVARRHGAAIEMPGGQVTVEATGSNATDNVTLENGSRILAQGSTYTLYDQSVALPAGTVALTSQHGDVNLQNGTLIDLSAAAGGDAGTLAVSAVHGVATLAGTLKGGKNAQAILDANMISNFSQALAALHDFSGMQSYRVRTGDVTIAAADNVLTRQFVLAADTGAITVNGKVDASGDSGGSIELYAKNDVTVNPGAQLLAKGLADTESTAGSNGKGGMVVLSSDSGTVKAVSSNITNADGSVTLAALIDVSGDQAGKVEGESGKVILRAGRSGTDNTVYNPVAATVSSSSIAVNLSGFSLVKGAVVAFTPASNPTGMPTLNVSGTGAKGIRKDGGTAISSGDIKANKVYLAVYDGTNFQLVSAASNANGSDAVGSGVRVDAGTTGAITGASEVLLEAVRTYEKSTINTNLETLLAADTRVFTSLAPTIMEAYAQTRDGVTAKLVPGVEVRSSVGDLTLSSDWDLGNATSTLTGIPMTFGGVLTLRAKGDLLINSNLNYEQYTISTSATATQLANLPEQRSGSWSYRLTAGADFTSASPEQVTSDAGNLTLLANKYVRTGAGFIDASAGKDISLGSGAAIYTEGLPDESYPNQFTGLASSASTPFINYKTYRELYPDGGGNVRLTAGGNITGAALDTQTTNWLLRGAQYSNPLASNPQLRWWPRMLNTSTSSSDIAIKNLVGTMGGGDVTLRAGGSVKDIQVAAASNGRIGGSTSQPIDEANFSERGGGDVAVTAGKDMSNVLLVVGKGLAEAYAGGSLSAKFALMDGSARAMATGDVTLTGVYNPTAVTAPTVTSTTSYTSMYFYSYGQGSGVRALSTSGDVNLLGSDIYPSNVVAVSPNGNVTTSKFTLYPSADGNATLLAGHNVLPWVSISDVDPSTLPTVFTQPSTSDDPHNAITLKFASYAGSYVHTAGGLHSNDTEPVRIYAGNDVVFQAAANAESAFSKPVEIRAGNDVVDANLIVQNLHATDISVIEAGNSIRYSDTESNSGSIEKNSAGIQVAGPGRLHLLAGGDIDLGASDGVRSVGDLYNPYLSTLGADIMVQPGAAAPADYAGMIAAYLAPATAGSFSAIYLPQLVQYMRERNSDPDLMEDEALVAFTSLDRQHQAQFIDTIFFAEVRAGGRDAIDNKNSRYGDYTRAERAILRMFPDFTANEALVSKPGSLMTAFGKIADEAVTHPGDLKLFYSQIRSERGGRIEMLVPGGMVNAGLAVVGALKKSSTDLGIVSLRGGDIDAMVRADFQVNTSRVFTLGGSDLMLFSALADIDAGRGAKTASATPPPVLRIKNGQVVYDYSSAVSGSGIAALIATGGKPGTVDLFAPYGEINAGEAGIRSAGNINLGARIIVGGENIQAGGITSGMPSVDTSGLSLSVPGVTDAASTKSGDQIAQAQAASQLAENKVAFLHSFISVEVIGLGSENEEQDEKKKKEKRE